MGSGQNRRALTSTYSLKLPGQPAPAGSRATDEHGGHRNIAGFMEPTVLERVQRLRPIAAELGLELWQLAINLGATEPECRLGLGGRLAARAGCRKCAAFGIVILPELMEAIDEALSDVVERDPAKTVSPEQRPA